MRDYYAEIDKALKEHEQGKYAQHEISWITDRISWCYKFKHISHIQMSSLCDRAIAVMNNEVNYG